MIDDFARRFNFFEKYSEDDFKLFLSKISPSKASIISIAQEYNGNLTEPYFGVKYSTEPIAPAVVSAWENMAIDPALKVPSPNEFIPQTEALAILSADEPSKPEKIVD